MSREFESVWDALANNPEEAKNLKLRSELMRALKARIAGMKQADAATLLGVEQPRVSEINKGKLQLFALEKLVKMATRAGMDVQIEIRQPVELQLA